MTPSSTLPTFFALTILLASLGCTPPADTEQPATTPAEDSPVDEASSEANRTETAMTTDAPVALIPREILFGNPDKAGAQLSPDGKRIAFLAPVDGLLNVWVGPADDLDAAKPVTRDTIRGIRSYFWAYTGNHILYTQDSEGDENWRVFCVDLATDTIRDITPMPPVQEKEAAQENEAKAEGDAKPAPITAQIDGVSHRSPETILIGLNVRDPKLHDTYRVNILTGEHEMIQENPGYAGFMFDEDYNLRFAITYQPDGSQRYDVPDGDGFKEFLTIPEEDTMTTSPSGFSKDGQTMYLIDSRGRDTGALTTIDLKTGEQEVLAHNDKTDIQAILGHPTEHTVQAVTFNYTRKEWKFFDKEVESDIKHLGTLEDGDVGIASRTLDDRKWIIAYLLSDGPVNYYLFDRDTKERTFLFTNRKDLEGQPLVKMKPAVITARDGLKLVSYYSLPKGSDGNGDGRPDEPLPMVLLVHGGPWSRDRWGYDPLHQLMANRGYAVLSVNFRGSTGFGKNFINAGNKEWAKKMQDDLDDAVAWAVEQGIADADRVAIMGGSYGGYATLVGMTMTPDNYVCGVDIVGPSNLVTLLESIPPYWAPALQMFKDRVGDHTTDEGRAALEKASPLNYVEKISRPLMIGQGANDPRVKQPESDQIVEAMQAKNIPVTYVLFSDEGHGFRRPPNRLAFYAVVEPFLARHLGGRFEPLGDALTGSSITVPTGAEGVEGLPEALELLKAK